MPAEAEDGDRSVFATFSNFSPVRVTTVQVDMYIIVSEDNCNLACEKYIVAIPILDSCSKKLSLPATIPIKHQYLSNIIPFISELFSVF